MRQIHELKIQDTEFNYLYNNQKHVLVLEKNKYNIYDYILITSSEETNTKDVLIELHEIVENENIKEGFVIFKTNQIQKGV